MSLTVATLNILNTADRWEERRIMIERELVRLAPDVIGIQEVDFGAGQDERLATAMHEPYAVLRGHEDRPDFGNSVLVRQAAFRTTGDAERIDLGDGRAAVVVMLATADRRQLRAATTHLAWEPDRTQVRLEQVRRLLGAIDEAASTEATIITGDFNAPPDESAIAMMRGAGFESAYLRANGEEPDWTYPTPMTPPELAAREPACIDYIWIRGEVQVQTARTAFDTPQGDLYPSDHRGIVAELDLRIA